MGDIIENLMSVGLSRVEAETYLSILTNCPIGAGKIARLTHNYRANVYQAIERLKSKGFISEVFGKKSKMFEALSPDHLLNDINKKSEAMKNIMPILKKMKSTSIETTSMRIIEGLNGWKHLLDEFLDIGEERVVYGIPKNVEMLKDFFKEYHQKRAKRKLWLRHLFNYDARERIKTTKKMPYTESRYLPKELDQPVSTSICGPLIALTVYQSNDGDNILTVVIENKIIADTYRKYFNYLWKKAKTL
jgi:sugar-specific transcriptional regulator TrmB